MNTAHSRNIIILDFAEIWLRPDSSLLVTFNAGLDINYQHIRKLMSTINSISTDRTHPLVLDLRQLNSLGIDARSYLLSERAAKLKHPLALIVSNGYQKALYHMVCMVFKPSFTIHAFRKETAAIQWATSRPSYPQIDTSTSSIEANAA